MNILSGVCCCVSIRLLRRESEGETAAGLNKLSGEHRAMRSLQPARWHNIAVSHPSCFTLVHARLRSIFFVWRSRFASCSNAVQLLLGCFDETAVTSPCEGEVGCNEPAPPHTPAVSAVQHNRQRPTVVLPLSACIARLKQFYAPPHRDAYCVCKSV